MEIRQITSVDLLRMCEKIERHVWDLPDLEIMPASHLAATVHAGGLVAAAFNHDTMVGFVYGFIAHRPEHAPDAYGMHSHLLAVLPEYRNAGIGMSLKAYQRDWCTSQGLPWITWTFDPLQAKNARLNLEHLGAVANRYIINAYGQLGGPLNAELPTDRLLAFWKLESPPTRLAAPTGSTKHPSSSDLPLALTISPDQEPLRTTLSDAAEAIRVQIPHDITSIIATQPHQAHRWRLALRDTLTHYLAQGYTITRFIDNYYVLERH
jgi:chorismate synthase